MAKESPKTPIQVHGGEKELTRRLGLMSAIVLGVGTTVGSGIFTSVGGVAGTAGTAVMTIWHFDWRFDHDSTEFMLYRVDDSIS